MQQTLTAIGSGWGSSGVGGHGHGWSLLALEALALTEYEEVVVLDQKARTVQLYRIYCCCLAPLSALRQLDGLLSGKRDSVLVCVRCLVLAFSTDGSLSWVDGPRGGGSLVLLYL